MQVRLEVPLIEETVDLTKFVLHYTSGSTKPHKVHVRSSLTCSGESHCPSRWTSISLRSAHGRDVHVLPWCNSDFVTLLMNSCFALS